MSSAPPWHVHRGPEDLLELVEDAVVAGDHMGLTSLFGAGAVVALDGRPVGPATLLRLADAGRTLVADGGRTLQSHDVALTVGTHATVARRSDTGQWRLVIADLTTQPGRDQT